MSGLLVLNIGGIGDMVLATPALRAIAAQLEGDAFDLLTSKRSVTVIERAPFIRDIHTIDVSLLTGRKNLRTLFRLIVSLFTLLLLRFRRYDIVIDLMAVESPQASRRRKCLIDIIRPKSTAGRNTDGLADFYHTWAPETLLSDIHEATRKLSVPHALGYAKAPTHLEVFSTEGDGMSAESLIDSIKVDGKGNIAVLIPGSWRPTRRWAEERFIETGTYLHKAHDARVVVCGARDERDVIDRVASGIPNAVSLIDIPARVLFELFRRASIVITNDTGPMHIAVAARAPIVSIFGPENPRRYAPAADESPAVALHRGVECAPCVKYTCDDMKCLQGIDVGMVLEAVDAVLSETGGESANA